MELKVIQLTDDEQLAELEDMQAEIMRMFEADPDKLGVILAQIIPPMGVMRVRVIGPDMTAKMARILPIEWASEGWDEPAVLDGFMRCTWWERDGDHWETQCSETILFADGTPAENNMRFCPYCGRVLQEAT